MIILKDGKIAALSNLEEERKANLKFLELEVSQNRQWMALWIGPRTRLRVRQLQSRPSEDRFA